MRTPGPGKSSRGRPWATAPLAQGSIAVAAARGVIADGHAALVATADAREEVLVFPSDNSGVVAASDGGARRAYAWLSPCGSVREVAERVDGLRDSGGFL